LPRQETITVHQLKQIYDNFIQFSSSASSDYLINILYLLDDIDFTILTDPLIVNHQFYSLLTHILNDILKKWHHSYHLIEYESIFFRHIIRIFSKIKANPEKLIQSMKKCLKDIVNDGKYLYDKHNMKYFSKLVILYSQNQQIMDAIIKCLCSKYYSKMFKQADNEKFLLKTCPMCWIAYRGPNREEMANMLLNTLLAISTRLLQQQYSNSWSKNAIQLLNLLNHCFTLCSSNMLTSEHLVPLTDVLLRILNQPSMFEENQPMIKSVIYLLLTFINNNERILQYCKQRQEFFQKLSDKENEMYLILMPLMSDDEIKTMNNNNGSFSLILRRYLEEQNDEESPRINSLRERLKHILEEPVNQKENTNERAAPAVLPTSSIVSSNENKNQEEITLIWYDKNIGIRDDTKKTIELLQKINDYVLICSNRETCIEKIGQIKTEKIFLILSGSSAQDILDEIHDHQQIDSIYIFCMKREKYEMYLNNDKYYKVIGIYIQYTPLLIALQENMRYCIKQSEAASLFDQDERAMRNLNRDINDFLNFMVFKEVLLKTDYNSDTAKKEMIDICRNYYRKNKKELSNIDEFERTYKPENAIYWYTKQTFVYRVVNKALRTEDYEAMLTLRFFIVDLCKNLKQKYDDMKEKMSNSNLIISYRGLKLTSQEIYNLKHNIGTNIVTNGYLSTSRSKNVAYTFAKKGTKCPNVETVMLEIDVDISTSTTSLADIAQYSDYPEEEEEILFDLGASFAIDAIDYENIQKMWHIKLKAISKHSSLINIETLLKGHNSEKDMNILLGKLLYKVERFALCRKYFNNLINYYKDDEHEKLASIYDIIGRTYADEDVCDKAIENYTKALNHYKLSNNIRDSAIVKNSMSTIYYKMNDKERSRVVHKDAYDMWIKTIRDPSDKSHCEFGCLMHNFGRLENDNQVARNYFFQALDIYQNSSNICYHNSHDDLIAQVYQDISNRYDQENDYRNALVFIKKSVNIRAKNASTIYRRDAFDTCLVKLITISMRNNENPEFLNIPQFYHLFNMHPFKLWPILKSNLYSCNSIDGEELIKQMTLNNSPAEFLEYSLTSLKSILKTNPTDYEKIIQTYCVIGLCYEAAKEYEWSCQHYEKALEICQTHMPNDMKHISQIYRYLSSISLKKNDYDQAFDFGIKALNTDEKTCHLGDKEKEAQCYFDFGAKLLCKDINKSFEFNKKSLELRQQILPADHVTIGFSHQDVGVSYEYKDILDSAVEHYKKAIEIYEKHLLDKEEYQFNVKQLYSECHLNVAKIYSTQNKYDDAVQFRIKALSIDEKTCHLTDKEKEAQAYFDIGEELLCKDLNKAFEFSKKSLEIRQQILPVNHVTIGFSHQDMGAAYENKGMLDAAVEHYKKAIEIYEKHVFDKEEYQFNVKELYSQCHVNIARINSRQNKYDDAVELRMKALNIDKKTSQLTAKEKEAQCYFDIGEELYAIDIDRALEFSKKSLEIRQQILPADHATIGFSHQDIGAAYEKKRMFDAALEYYKKAIEIYEKHLLDTEKYQFNIKGCFIQCHSNIARMYQNQCNYDKSTEFCIAVIKKMESIFSTDNNSFLAECYRIIGFNYHRKLQYDLSIEFYQKCLNIYEALVQNSIVYDYKTEISSCLIDLNCVYMGKQEYDCALNGLEKVKQMLPDNHINLDPCYFNIGLCYQHLKKYEKAIENFNLRIENFEKNLSTNREIYALSLLNIGMCCSYMGKTRYASGINYTLKAIEIYEQYFPDNKNDIAQCYFTYGFILTKQGQYDQAINALQKSLDIRLIADTIDIAFCYANLSYNFYKNCEYQQALSLAEQALKTYEKHLPNLVNENIGLLLNNMKP
ncbi:unnamed protein product, partial [Rotaria sp. Silwood1]